jgi:hypothetical protein
MYFPYSYTFCRRINRSPTTTLQQWREYFYPKHSTIQTDTSGGGGDEIQNLSHDWDMSGLEEGEDSDGEDQKSILGPSISILRKSPAMKKRTTRMSSTNQRRGMDKHHQHPSLSLSADLLVQMQSPGGRSGAGGGDDDGLLEIQDMSFETPKSHRNPNTLSLHSDSEKSSPKIWENSHQRSTPPKSDRKTSIVKETISLEDLRKAFSQSLDDDDSDLAEKG